MRLKNLTSFPTLDIVSPLELVFPAIEQVGISLWF